MSDRHAAQVNSEEKQRIIERLLTKVDIYYKTFGYGVSYADLNRLMLKQFKHAGLDLYQTCIALTKDDSLRITMSPTGNARLFPLTADLDAYFKANPQDRIMKT